MLRPENARAPNLCLLHASAIPRQHHDTPFPAAFEPIEDMSAPGGGSRFTTQNQTTDQRLSNNVVGLVELSDFRKRRAEVLEQQEREAREAAAGGGAANGDSGGLKAVVDAETPDRSQTGTPVPGSAAEARAGGEGGGESAAATEATGEPAKKKKKTSKEGMEGRDGGKKKKGGKASKLSFLGDEDEEEEAEGEDNGADATPRGTRKGLRDDKPRGTPKTPKDDDGPADGVPPPIKSFTQQAQRRQAAEREALRREFLALQAAVKAAEVAIPFVFYEGANIPGGVVRVRKGDFVWQFLDRSRKVGARLGVGEKRLSKARLHWARINVDDLMLVRGNLIIPHVSSTDLLSTMPLLTMASTMTFTSSSSTRPSAPVARAFSNTAASRRTRPPRPVQPPRPRFPPATTTKTTAAAATSRAPATTPGSPRSLTAAGTSATSTSTRPACGRSSTRRSTTPRRCGATRAATRTLPSEGLLL